MSIHPVGCRVLAVRDGSDVALNVFGVGTYVGTEIPPSRFVELTDQDRADYEQIIRHADEAAERNREATIRFWQERGVIAEDELEAKRAEMIARDEAEEAKPLDQRITEWYERAMGNPKIVLDSGDVVWGYQCWWGPVDRVRARYGRLDEVEVPVPEGNEHIDGWVRPDAGGED